MRRIRCSAGSFRCRASSAIRRLREVAAGEVVDAAIALGLADDGDDVAGANRSVRDQPLELREVAGMRHRQSEDLRRPHILFASGISSNSRLGLSGISSNSISFLFKSSASSIACAKKAAALRSFLVGRLPHPPQRGYADGGGRDAQIFSKTAGFLAKNQPGPGWASSRIFLASTQPPMADDGSGRRVKAQHFGDAFLIEHDAIGGAADLEAVIPEIRRRRAHALR